MVVIVRVVDGKRRVTLPASMDVIEGSQVVVIASKEAAVVAADRATAQKLSEAIREIERGNKHRVIAEWAGLVEQAGLSGLMAGDIDSLVDGSVNEGVFGRGKESRP